MVINRLRFPPFRKYQNRLIITTNLDKGTNLELKAVLRECIGGDARTETEWDYFRLANDTLGTLDSDPLAPRFSDMQTLNRENAKVRGTRYSLF